MEDNFFNILGSGEIDTLFQEDSTESEKDQSENTEEIESTNTEESKDAKTTETKSSSLFEGDSLKSESVGSEEDTEGKGDSSTDDGGGTSPNENFYSSIANAMAEDGIFPNLDEETVSKADSAEALSDLIEKEVNARLDEKQQRISKALEDGVPPSAIRSYEQTIQYLISIKDDDLSAETEDGERLRYRLIYQDYINNGKTPEKAEKLAKRSIDQGTDLEDAKDALQENKKYFQTKYNHLLKEAEAEAESEKTARLKQTEKLKESILKDKTLLGDLEVSQDVRKKTLDFISKPAYKDPETGAYLTAIQKYERENPTDFIKYVGLVMTLTNNFKDFESFTRGKVKREVNKGMRALEHSLNGTRRNSSGGLKMVTKATDDPESIIPSGFKLAL